MGRTYPNEIDRILRAPGGDVGREARKLALEIADEARRTAEQVFGRHPGDAARTGRLAASYQVKVIPGTNHFIVRNPRKYAASMELGARPHEIRARRSQFLQFRGRDGRWRKVKLVRHPGSVGRHTLLIAGRVVTKRRYGAGRPG
jgi:hypothetical protein